MTFHIRLILCLWSLLGAACATPRHDRTPPSSLIPQKATAIPAGVRRGNIEDSYGRLPLRFERNLGQTAEEVAFLARGRGYTLFLTAAEAVLTLHTSAGQSGPADPIERLRKKREYDVLRMQLVGAQANPPVEGQEQLPGIVNYFTGNDPEQWRTHIPTYAKVRYREVYPGIDLVYYGNQRHLEYDFVVTPGADPDAIRLAFAGAERIEKDTDGTLLVQTNGGIVSLQKPLVYQEIDGKKRPVAGDYVLLPAMGSSSANSTLPDAQGHRAMHTHIGLHLATYDQSKPLVIDPVLVYSTYLGGSGFDQGLNITIDATGRAYVTGSTDSLDFPIANAFQSTFGGNTIGLLAGGDVFVTKLDPSGSALIYSTYLGGSGFDQGLNIAIDAMGQAHVTGFTSSGDFPTTNAFQPTFGGGPADAFVTKLAASGSALIYSTYLGGSNSDFARGIKLDAIGQAYVAGPTASLDFPIASAFQPTFGGGGFDAFVTKLAASGSALIYSTYLGGSDSDSGRNIALGARDQVYVAGDTNSSDFPILNAFQPAFGGNADESASNGDAFVTKFDPTGSGLIYSTYLGGSDSESARGIAIDVMDQASVVGDTNSSDFPILNAFQPTFSGNASEFFPTGDAFVTKLAASGTALLYSTYLGGSGFDSGRSIAVDATGQTYLAGFTDSPDFPIEDPFQTTLGGGSADVFVTKLAASGTALIYSTYLGGSGFDFGNIAIDATGNAYVAGDTGSPNFPTTNAFQPTFNGGLDDAFVTKIAQSVSLSVSPLALAFGAVAVGSSRDLSLTLQNLGDEVLSGTVGAPLSPFNVISGGEEFSLTAGASRVVDLRFSPTNTGAFGGTVTITSTGGIFRISLSGTSISIAPTGPALAVCGTSLDFAQVPVGSSAELSCTVTNTGLGILEGTAVVLPPFSLVSDASLSLAADQSQDLTLRFSPESLGPVEAEFRLSSNGGSATVLLSGTGTQGPILAVSPATLVFGSVRGGQSRALSLTVQNIGGETLSRNVCVPVGFSLVSAAAFSLPAGQSQPLTVRFSPPRAGVFNATVTFTANPCNDEDPQPDPAVVVVRGVGMVEEAFGTAYVVNRGSNTLSVVNVATQAVEADIPVGNSPVALALTPDTRKVYVVNSASNDVSVIDTTTRQVTTTIAVGLNPIAIVISADGQRAYVANAGPGEDSVAVLDLTSEQLLSIQDVFRPIPSVLALNPADTVLYILGTGSDLVGLLETTTNQAASLKTGRNPVAVAFSPDGNSAYVVNKGDNTVSVLDARTFPPFKVCDVAVEDAPVSVVVTPDGEKVYVANSDDSLSVFDPCTPIQLPPSAVGQARPKETLASDRIVIPNWEGSINLQFDPNFPIQLLVVNSTSNNVGILDITTDQALATIPVGTTPEQSAFDTELPQAVVTNFDSDDVTLVNTDNASTTSVPVGDEPVDVVFTVQTLPSEPPVPQGLLENPQPDSFQSGIGVISGFVCDASQILVEFNGTATFEAAYGTSRGDTQDICGDSNNGFSLLFNWNLLGDGTHTVRAIADGVEFANVTIMVTTLGLGEFVTGLSGQFSVSGFPTDGETTQLRWQQSQQNFVIFRGAGSGGGNSGVAPRVLENPQPGSFQSGIGVISGFVCEATLIAIEFDGVATFEAAYGTSRGDTQEVCGDTNNGFSLLFNWNLLGDGEHTVRAFADGIAFAEVTLTVTTLGLGEFPTGLSGEFTLSGFPQAGNTTSVRWQQSQQNFVIAEVF